MTPCRVGGSGRPDCVRTQVTLRRVSNHFRQSGLPRNAAGIRPPTTLLSAQALTVRLPGRPNILQTGWFWRSLSCPAWHPLLQRNAGTTPRLFVGGSLLSYCQTSERPAVTPTWQKQSRYWGRYARPITSDLTTTGAFGPATASCTSPSARSATPLARSRKRSSLNVGTPSWNSPCW